MSTRICICGALIENAHHCRKYCPTCAKNRDRISKGIQLASDAIVCPVCHEKFNKITAGHYKKHGFVDAQSFKDAFQLESLCAPSLRLKQSNFMSQNSPTKGRKRTVEEIRCMKIARTGKGIGVSGKYERTPEIREKISDGVTDFLQKHPDWSPSKFFKAQRVLSNKADQEVWVRSSWEARVLAVLEHYDVITEVSVEPFRIPYEFEGSIHQYLPDFLVEFDEVTHEIWEVKPECYKNTPRNQAKFEAARRYADEHGMGFRVVTLQDIERMEKWLSFACFQVDE